MIRFLQRAASNLQQEFKVVVPSLRLPINSRRTILAAQLRDFVHIYNAVCATAPLPYSIAGLIYSNAGLIYSNIGQIYSNIGRRDSLG